MSVECIEISLSGLEQFFRQDDGLERIEKDNSIITGSFQLFADSNFGIKAASK